MKERLTNFGLAGLVLGLFCLIAATFGLDTMRDALHRGQTFVPAPEVQLVGGKCKSRLFVITACTIDLADARTSTKTSKEYFFLGSNSQTISIMRSASDESYLTTSLGEETFWMRLLMLLPLLGMFLFGAVKVALAKPQDGKQETAAA